MNDMLLLNCIKCNDETIKDVVTNLDNFNNVCMPCIINFKYVTNIQPINDYSILYTSDGIFITNKSTVSLNEKINEHLHKYKSS